ncbi:MAG: FAD-binding protein [Paracoccus sp. (in: a-proteobacteria)]|nr:FAD-binding protein [Paracoccus sp. (in: a-proteobacteria)]
MQPETLAHLAPASEEEVTEVIRERLGRGLPVKVTAGGTRIEAGHLPHQSLSTNALSGVVSYEPGEMTLIARAGTPLADIESMLAAEGQSLAFEPPDMRCLLGQGGTPTLGGVIATNASGPRRLQAGACRDHVLGLRFVDGQGRLIKTGGRVMKNVTGLDLCKLHCGGYGTLGIVTEIAIKTLPLLPAQGTLAVRNVTAEQAVAIFAKALSTPFEVSGAAWQEETAFLRIEGLEPQMRYRRDRLLALFTSFDIELLEDEASRALWRSIRDVESHAGTGQPVWKILVKPSDGPLVLQELTRRGGSATLDWGGGLVWYSGPAAADEVRRAAAPGHATLIRRSGLPGPAFPPQSGAVRELSVRIRQTFDPAGIFNTGLMDA